MGIKNFFRFLNIHCPECIKYIPKKELENKVIGIDANFWVYQIMASLKANNICIYNEKGDDITHLYGLYTRIVSILRMFITPIFVFDGKPPDLKRNTILKRKSEKKKASLILSSQNNSFNSSEKKKLIYSSVHVSKKEIDDCKKLLDIMNIHYIESSEEADSQLASLKKEKCVDFIISNDYDIIAFGGNNLLPYFKSGNKLFPMIDINILKKKFFLNDLDVIKISMILGNDYTSKNNDFYNVDPYDIIKIVKEKTPIFDNDEYKKIISYFKNPKVEHNSTIKYKTAICDIDIYKLNI
jgi:flap endonuclease-1